MNEMPPWTSKLNWQQLGEIAGNLKLPAKLKNLGDKCPSLYWLHFKRPDLSDCHYIGQSKRLRERLTEYTKPTLGTLQEYYIRQAIQKYSGATVWVCTASKSDIADAKKRLKLEKDEIEAASVVNTRLLNRHGKLFAAKRRKLAKEAAKHLLKDWLKDKQFNEPEPVEPEVEP